MIIPNLLDEMQADSLNGTRIAENAFQASHIANGLHLAECESLDEARARWRRYRGWKIAGEQTRAAYRRAIDGEEPPRIKCYYCGTLDGFHVDTCRTKDWSDEMRDRVGIVVNKYGLWKAAAPMFEEAEG